MDLKSLNKLNKEETVALRRKYIPSCVQLYFQENPLKIVKGSGQYMYDENGNKYLDCINNVAHVGHCHPHVVKSAYEQASLLETNSRFLHDNLVIYTKRISAYLPPQVDYKFVFANSGSEANDLSLRIARRITGGYDVIILDHAYHGHLTSLVDISPYKFKQRSGEGQKEYVHVAPVPDVYRGKYRSSDYNDDQLCDLYVNEVIQIVENAEKKNRKIAIFLAESLQSCGGQIIYPKNYLKNVYNYLHSKGILCLADEVQCGFYRTGSHMWGFQIYGDIVPDFVTMGKSMGNGHPVSCLVMKSELAEGFGKDGLQYFNTYGGNPVSVAVANAVLDVIENEKLYKHVTDVSNHLLNELERLKNKHTIIGDIRGYGYFIGIDYVKDRNTREPAIAEAKLILEEMRKDFVLLSLDGPYSNVMKIKPPLPFNKDDADHLISKLDKILTTLGRKSKL